MSKQNDLISPEKVFVRFISVGKFTFITLKRIDYEYLGTITFPNSLSDNIQHS